MLESTDLPGQKLAQHVHHQPVVFFLRQAGHGHGAYHADVAHDDGKRSAMRRILIDVETRRLLEGRVLRTKLRSHIQ